MNNNYLSHAHIDTPLGTMLAVADEQKLYLLEFLDRKNLNWELNRLQQSYRLTPGSTPAIRSIEEELHTYFNGTLHDFKTPYKLVGTPFQQHVWKALTHIQYGTTQSYAQLAESINKPTAFRAVALANSVNQLCIIVPCHRVINKNGGLSGYGAGTERKQWLLEHEYTHRKLSNRPVLSPMAP